MSTTNLEHSGAFRFAPSTGTWTWSETVFELYGFRPGEVVPTTELILFHQHPQDREDVEAFLAVALATGRPGSVWHRVVDAQGATRQVVTLLAGERDEHGALTGLSGSMVDVTEAVRQTTAREVDVAMELMAQSRPFIEQAKGVLMVTYAVDADAAFALLRSYSQLVNVKVRDVARDLLDSVTAGAGLPVDSRADLDRLASETRLAGPARRP